MMHRERSATFVFLCIEPLCVHACINTLCIRLLMKSSLESNYALLNLGWNWNLKISASLKRLRVTAVLLHVAMHNSHILCMFGDQTLFFFQSLSPASDSCVTSLSLFLPGLRDSGTNVSEEKGDGRETPEQQQQQQFGSWEGFATVREAEECGFARRKRLEVCVRGCAQGCDWCCVFSPTTPLPPRLQRVYASWLWNRSARCQFCLTAAPHENPTKAVRNWRPADQN